MFGLFKSKKPKSSDASGRRPGFFRSFAAAQVSRTMAPWIFDGGFSNLEISSQLATIRSRSRDMQKNAEHFANFVRFFRNNVVGRGFILKAQPSPRLGSLNIDQDAKRTIEYHFWKWSKSRRECDVSARHNLSAIFRLMAGNWARDGEAIALIERDAPTRYGVQLRVVRPDALDETLNRRGVTASTVIVNGVEIDVATRRPVAYWFKTLRDNPSAVFFAPSRPLLRVPSSDVIHLFSTEDAGQTRGVPLTHASLKKGKMLDAFNDSELVAALDETNTIGTFKDKKGRSPKEAGFDDDGDAEGYSDEEKAAYTRKSEPGTKLWLDGDIDFDWHTPTHPNREVGPFKKTMLRDIASGLGVDYPTFANDLADVNYSSIRAGTIVMRDNWRVLQDDFVDQVATPVFEAWLASFLSRPVGNPYVPSDFDRLCEHEFQGRTWDWVDPLKDVNASAVAVEHGWKTNEEVTAQFGGADFLENCARIKIENQAKAAAGMSLTPARPGGSAVTTPTDTYDEGDDTTDEPED